MAFNLKKVLKALLFSSSQPLTVKDVQTAFARFHEQATLPVAGAKVVADTDGEGAADADGESGDSDVVVAGVGVSVGGGLGGASSLGGGGLPAEAEIEVPEVAVLSASEADAELYGDVPSLVTASQIREAMDELAKELRAADDVYLLVDGASGYRLVTHPRYARWIRIQRNEPIPTKLTQSALETLSIVAYRQPVTRTEVETIRGVSVEGSLNRLAERELVYVVGRADLPGRPLQYGTTDKFLEFVGVKSLVELPASDVLSPRQIDEWLKNSTNAKPPADAEMGLPLEEGEGSSPNLEPVAVEHVETGASGTNAAVSREPDADLFSHPHTESLEQALSGKAHVEEDAEAAIEESIEADEEADESDDNADFASTDDDDDADEESIESDEPAGGDDDWADDAKDGKKPGSA